jgi:hypothetical protein
VHAAGENDAVVREHVGVELDVLADFLAVRALEPSLQQIQRNFGSDLSRCSWIVVCKRQIDRLVAEGERQADQARRHRLFARPHGIEADHVDGLDLEEEILQRILIHNRAPASLAHVARGLGRHAGRSGGCVLHFLEPAPELEPPIELALLA